MDNTKVGTVEQLRFNRRPWEKNTLYGLKVPLTFKCRELCPWLINVSWGNKHSISLTSIITFWWFWYIIKLRSFLRFQLHPLSFKKVREIKNSPWFCVVVISKLDQWRTTALETLPLLTGWLSFHLARWCGPPESGPSPRSAQGCADSPADTKDHQSYNINVTQWCWCHSQPQKTKLQANTADDIVNVTSCGRSGGPLRPQLVTFF